MYMINKIYPQNILVQNQSTSYTYIQQQLQYFWKIQSPVYFLTSDLHSTIYLSQGVSHFLIPLPSILTDKTILIVIQNALALIYTRMSRSQFTYGVIIGLFFNLFVATCLNCFFLNMKELINKFIPFTEHPSQAIQFPRHGSIIPMEESVAHRG